jgi:predicted RecB family nuclease
MKITSDLFHTFLKCPTKCWLRVTSEFATGNSYSEWVKEQHYTYRTTQSLGREISFGKIIHGDNRATLKVKISTLVGEVRKRINEIAVLLASTTSPELILNRHCTECEFQTRCHNEATQQDDLSLLSSMTGKERKRLNSKGTFTVKQLSFAFLPRRRPKKLRDKQEKYHSGCRRRA